MCVLTNSFLFFFIFFTNCDLNFSCGCIFPLIQGFDAQVLLIYTAVDLSGGFVLVIGDTAMSSLSRELVFLILQFLDEEKFKETVHKYARFILAFFLFFILKFLFMILIYM